MGTPAAGGRRPQGFRSLCQSFHQVFIKLGEYVGGHNISTKFYDQPDPPGTPEIKPFKCPKTKLAVSALKGEYAAPKYSTASAETLFEHPSLRFTLTCSLKKTTAIGGFCRYFGWSPAFNCPRQ